MRQCLVLNLSVLLGKKDIAKNSLKIILKTFVKNENEIYSQICIGGIKNPALGYYAVYLCFKWVFN